MKFFETIILGGGASGCMCALQAKGNVAIIDKQNRIAKKLLVTGNGRCNLTNLNAEAKFYNDEIVENYLKRFDVDRTLAFFDNIGLVMRHEQDKVYPLSNSAKSVVDVINNALKAKEIKTFTNCEILDIKIENSKFVLEGQTEQFSCNKLVIASGGKSVENFLTNYNIPHSTFCPSLCAIKTTNTHSLNNVKLHDVKVCAVTSDGKTKLDRGEVLFKESGLSGIVIFNLSSLFAREKNFAGKISIDLLPDLNNEEILKLLNKRRALKLEIPSFFDGVFVKEIGYEILNRCKLDENRTSDKLSDKEIEKFASVIKNLDFDVKGYYENNQVYSGGVRLEALSDNLECKNIKNLYFCGEICDIDGECGGYNLQWAWTSGAIVGKAL